MPTYGENVAEIIVRARAEGRSEVDVLRQAYAELLAQVKGTQDAMAAGEMPVNQAMRAFGSLEGQIKKIVGVLRDIDPEWARMQESLKRMDDETAKSSIEAARMRTQASRTVIDSLHQQEQEMAAVHAKLGQMEKRDAQDAAEAARLRGMSTREAVEQTNKQVSLEQRLRTEYEANYPVLVRAGQGMKSSDESAKRLGMSILYASHGIQDLTYSFAAFINNIPLIVQSMGGGAGVAGTIMLAGVAIDLLTPKIRDLIDYMEILGKKEPFPKASDSLDQMKGHLKEINDAIEHYHRLGRVTHEQAELTNSLRGMHKVIEKQITEEVERRNAMEDFRKGRSKEDVERGRAFTEAVGGDARSIERNLRKAMEVEQRKEVEGVTTLAERRIAGMAASGAPKAAVDEFAAKERDFVRRYVDMLAQRPLETEIANLIKDLQFGKKSAVERFRKLRDDMGIAFGDQFRERFEALQPEAIRAEKEQERRNKEAEQEAKGVLSEREKAAREAERVRKEAAGKTAQQLQQDVARLTSAKQKPFEDIYTESVLTRIAADQTREQIKQAISPDVERRLGDLPGAKAAAEKLIDHVLEKAFGMVAVEQGEGVSQPEAARRVRGQRAADAAAKAARGEAVEDRVEGKAEKQAEIDRIAKRFWELFPVTPQQAQAMAPGIFRASQRMDMDVAARRAYQQLTGEVNRAAFGLRRGRRGMGQVGPVFAPGMLDERVAPEPEVPDVQPRRRRRGPVPNRQAGADPLRQWQFERVTDVTPGLDPSRVNQMVGNVQVQEAKTLAAVAHGTEQATVMARQAMSILSTVQSRMKMLAQNRPTLMSSVPGAGK